MLHNLDWIREGEPFPPKSEVERLSNYAANRLLFESEHGEVYNQQLKRIERVIDNFGEVISYPVIVNFQKLISIKTADLLLGEPPQIESENEAEQTLLDNIALDNDLHNTLYMAAIDVSRYGDSILTIGDEKITLSNPSIWYPIVDYSNIHKILYHVIAWDTEDEMIFQIHEKGRYTKRVYRKEKNVIGRLLDEETISTGLSDFAVVQVSNIITSDRTHGIDDYKDIDSIISDIMVRIGQIDRILDKHAAPSMQGPSSALEHDPESGEWRLKNGNYFVTDEGENKVDYIVWNGQLESNFNQIERLINLLYTTSEMGSAIFGDMMSQSGQVPSGSALKRLMISPLAKVNRIRMRFDPAVKKLLRLCAESMNKKLVELTITWKDGLPDDEVEQANIMALRTNGKATISQVQAIKRLDSVDDDTAEQELERIVDEEGNMTLTPPPFSQGETSEE